MTLPARTYTPQEAAALAGVGLQRIQNAITERRLKAGFRTGHDGRRQLDVPAVLTFATAERLGKVRVEPELLYAAFRKTGIPDSPLAVTDSVTIDAPRLLEPVVRNMQLYERARERIICDPAIMVGEPVIKGTRLPARMLHARIKAGDSVDSVLAEYAYLDREAVEAAVLYIEANPPRGRPREPRTRG
jgi:uncharacterized protein (DUF433 family)